MSTESQQAHQDGWHEGRQYEVEFGVKSQRSEQQEWTSKTVFDLMGSDYGNDGWKREKLVASAHNTALAAERQRREHVEKQLIVERRTLLSAQAAIEKKDEALLHCTAISSIPLDYGFNVGPEFDAARKKATEACNIKVDLSLLHKRDKELKTAIEKKNEALRAISDQMSNLTHVLQRPSGDHKGYDVWLHDFIAEALK